MARTFKVSAVKELYHNGTRLFGVLWQKKKVLFTGMIFGQTMLMLLPYVQVWIRGSLVDQLIASARASAFSETLFVLVVAAIATDAGMRFVAIFNAYGSKLFWFYVSEFVDLSIIRKRGEIDIATYEDPKKLNEFNKVMENSWRMVNFADRQMYIVTACIEVVVGALAVATYSWPILVLVLCGTIPDLAVELKYGKGVWNIQSGSQDVRRKYWNVRYHFFNIPYLVELKLLQNIEHFWKQIGDLYESFREGERSIEKKKLIWKSTAALLSQSFLASATLYTVYSVVQGWVSVGMFTFVLASTGQLRNALSGLFSNIGTQYQDGLFVADFFSFLDTQPKLSRVRKAHRLKKATTPDIVFENVSFKYPDTDTYVLRNVSLSIPAGTKLAGIGGNGAGKTTFVKLLCRFYDPTEGRILVGGRDLRTIDLESWYEQLGIIFQDYAQYDFVVRDAIAVGRTSRKMSVKKVQEAAKAAEAEQFIEAWDASYSQQLGRDFTGGVEPSIGQWQKLALARTFYRDPSVMILDEPTSSIDAEAEAKIFERIEEMSDGRSVILISHRFSTVRHATQIVVIEHGTVGELGTHEQLINAGGTYARLFALQAEGYK